MRIIKSTYIPGENMSDKPIKVAKLATLEDKRIDIFLVLFTENVDIVGILRGTRGPYIRAPRHASLTDIDGTVSKLITSDYQVSRMLA